MSRRDLEIVRRSVEAFARRDNDATVGDYADDILYDMSGYTGWLGLSTYRGVEEIRQFFHEWLAPWADWRWEVIELIEIGDGIVVSGRDYGRLQGSPAEVENRVAQVWRVREGKIVQIATFRTLGEALEAAGAKSRAAGPEETPAAIVRLMLDAWNRGDSEAAAALFHEDAEVRSALAGSPEGDDLPRGPEGVRAWIVDNIGLRVDPEQSFCYGDYVLLLGTARGHRPAGRRDVGDQYGAVCRVANGCIVLFESHFDRGDALIALGRRLKGERRPGQEVGTDLDAHRLTNTAMAMSRENVEALRGLYQGWAAGDFSSAAPLLDQHVGFVVSPEFPTEAVLIGVDHLGRHMAELLEAWERLTVTAESFREAGNSVVVRVRQVGVGAGSGVPTEMTYFHVWTFRASKVIRLEVIVDETAALEAVGLRE